MIYTGQNDPLLVLPKLQFNDSLNIKFPLKNIWFEFLKNISDSSISFKVNLSFKKPKFA